MIYIVSGMPRCGTSLMMHILKTIGIEPNYDKEREEKIANPENGNPYYYEEQFAMIGRIEDINSLEDKCTKIFAFGIQQLSERLRDRQHKIIYMYRFPTDENPKTVLGTVDAFDLMVNCIYAYYNNLLIVDYNRLIDKPIAELNRIEEFLGFKFDVNDVSRVIEPGRRHRLKIRNMTRCIKNYKSSQQHSKTQVPPES